MHRLKRQILRPFLFAVLPLYLAACGNGSSSTTDAESLALISSAVFGEHSVVIDGTVTKSWGANGYGQLGIGNKLNKTTPVDVAGTPNYSAVSIGGAHSVGLDTANGGNVWTWGLNSAGQLGDGTLVTKTSPVQVTSLTGVKAIAAGGKHTLVIASDDTVRAWGYNASGQLGDGTLTTRSSPVQVLTSVGGPALTGVTAIAAGGDFSLALKSDGTVWAWGNNGKGQLGNNTFVTSKVPDQVVMLNPSDASKTLPLTGITAIAAGGSHALALKDDGTVYAWGYNEFGQLGDGTITSSSTAVAVVGTGPVTKDAPDNKIATAISAGLDHSLAIIDGTVKSWGYNYYGQLGNGAELASYLPVKTLQTVLRDQDGLPLSNIVEIIAAGHHCIARDLAGTIWTWGRNTHGELGDGTTVSRSKAKNILPAA